MGTRFVSSAYPVSHRSRKWVDVYLAPKADGASEPDWGTHSLLHVLGARHAHFRDAYRSCQLDLIELVITADNRQNWLALRNIDQALEKTLRRRFQERRDFFDTPLAWRRDTLQSARITREARFGCGCSSHFKIRGISTAFTGGNNIFPALN